MITHRITLFFAFINRRPFVHLVLLAGLSTLAGPTQAGVNECVNRARSLGYGGLTEEFCEVAIHDGRGDEFINCLEEAAPFGRSTNTAHACSLASGREAEFVRCLRGKIENDFPESPLHRKDCLAQAVIANPLLSKEEYAGRCKLAMINAYDTIRPDFLNRCNGIHNPYAWGVPSF